MTAKLIVLLGSDPSFGRGGAAKVVSAYQDFYARRSIACRLYPFHRMHKVRLFRIAPLFSLFPQGFRLLFRSDYRIHHHHTTVYDLFVLFFFCVVSATARRSVLVTFHNPKHFSRKDSLFTRVHFAFLSLLSRDLHFLNSGDYMFCRDLHLGFCLNNSFVSPNPLSLKLVSLFEQQIALAVDVNECRFRLPHPVITLGVLSVLRHGKRVDRAIKMLSHLPNYMRLRIAGTGEAFVFLKQLVTEMDLSSRVDFVGWIGEDQKKSFFSSLDLFVNSSDFDTQSLVVVESLAHGVPVVSIPNPVFLENYPPRVCIDYSADSEPFSMAGAVMSCLKRNKATRSAAEYLLSVDQRICFPV